MNARISRMFGPAKSKNSDQFLDDRRRCVCFRIRVVWAICASLCVTRSGVGVARGSSVEDVSVGCGVVIHQPFLRADWNSQERPTLGVTRWSWTSCDIRDGDGNSPLPWASARGGVAKHSVRPSLVYLPEGRYYNVEVDATASAGPLGFRIAWRTAPARCPRPSGSIGGS